MKKDIGRLSVILATVIISIIILRPVAPVHASRQDSQPRFEASQSVSPARVEVVEVPTKNIASPAKITVALPEGYADADNTDTYPVVYLLNGHGGDYTSWSKIVKLDSLATEFDVIFVCPDGRNSWYWDSPIDPKMQMESYIVDDLIPYIDSHYRTRADREGRAITGLSMGGHGGLWLGIRHSDLFANAGSTSGGVEITPYPKRWNMADRLGPFEKNRKRWEEHSVKYLVESGALKPGQLNIIFDCGTEDFFYKVNCSLDRNLTERGIEHTYLTSRGTHNPAYWSRSIIPQIEFFSEHFNDSAGE